MCTVNIVIFSQVKQTDWCIHFLFNWNRMWVFVRSGWVHGAMHFLHSPKIGLPVFIDWTLGRLQVMFCVQELPRSTYPLISLVDDIIDESLGHLTGSVHGSLQRMVQVALQCGSNHCGNQRSDSPSSLQNNKWSGICLSSLWQMHTSIQNVSNGSDPIVSWGLPHLF